ncbi:hypothetical protein B6N60_05193 [Richelia sinica FACHB-800]|uniref:Uncharacterized protein n=1 Tax=Richelia sinica FACHB-800 TaxID=1357546 RepID=A0A975Y7L7_9NOST|nr:hypothetical protein B6N60_05193 [Richelia sinica FACHB-800]
MHSPNQVNQTYQQIVQKFNSQISFNSNLTNHLIVLNRE